MQIAHCGDTDDVDYIEGLLAKGVYVGLDRYGLEMYLPIDKRNATAAELLRRGHAERLIISAGLLRHDRLVPAGGRARCSRRQGAIRNWSMTLVFEEVVPDLREQGVMDDDGREDRLRRQPAPLDLGLVRLLAVCAAATAAVAHSAVGAAGAGGIRCPTTHIQVLRAAGATSHSAR